jgi:hypothetical protein
MIQNVHNQQSRARRDGRSEEILATIPQHGGDAALEIVMTHDSANAAHIEFRYLVWGIGLGGIGSRHSSSMPRRRETSSARSGLCSAVQSIKPSRAWRITSFPSGVRATISTRHNGLDDG